MKAIPKNISTAFIFEDSLGLFPKHMVLVYRFIPLERLSTSKVLSTYPSIMNN
jgi:hypothetical protein